MQDNTFIMGLGWIVVGATVFAFLARRIGMPSIVAYLLAGLFLGPVTGLVEMSPALSLISEIGIALLLFLVGLELSFDKIKDVGKVAVVAGIGQVVFTALGGLVLCWLLGFKLMEAVFIAVGITFSSSVLAVKLLDEKGELDSLYGHIAVGCSLVQSFIVIIILSILSGLGGEGGKASVALDLALSFGGLLLLIAMCISISHFVISKLFDWAASRSDTLVIWSLGWCFAIIIAAKMVNLSLEIGAFLAGVSLAQLRYNADLHRRLHPLMNFFLAVFFVTLGVQMSLTSLSDGWLPPVAISLFVLFGNTLIYLLLIPRLGYSAETALLTGITGAQISEFSFILAATGASLGMLDSGAMSLMSIIGLLTMGVSAYMIRHNHRISSFLQCHGVLAWFEKNAATPIQTATGIRDHVLVVGMNSLGRKLATKLSEQGYSVVAVDTDPMKLKGLPCRTEIGNVSYRAVLDKLCYSQARLVISALRIDFANDLLAYRCREAGVPCAVHVHDAREMDHLLEIGTDYLMVSKVDGIKRLNSRLKEMGCMNAKHE